ncbi:MAG: DUF885 domain-containing protein [Gammaproteobacteria bacterium]|nr:MAG: DUF885 domain-containing protein [Gammaproteobacteria bacterium]
MKRLVLPIACALFICACQNQEPPVIQEKQNTKSEDLRIEKQKLDKLVADYNEEFLTLHPVAGTFQSRSEFNDKFGLPIGQKSRDLEKQFTRKYLKAISNIDVNKLDHQSKLTYDIFKSSRESSIESEKFPFHLMPINQMAGAHNFFATLGSGASAQPFNNEEDYRNFIKRSKGFAIWMESIIPAMNDGIEANVVLPQSILEKLIPQLKTHMVKDIKDSVFYKPLLDLPNGLNAERKSKLIADYERSIKETLIPVYTKVYNFLENDYKKYARKSVGLSQLPNGKAWYEYMIKTHTTLPLTAEEIHKFGLSEVARILAEMKKVKEQVSFEGDMPEFFEFLRTDDQFYFEEASQLVKAYEDTKIKIDATLPKLFEVFPKADYVVKPVPDFQAASSAGAYYESPAPDGSRPGVFYINTYNLRSQPKFLMETLSIHEAAPGHHFQIAIQQEVKGLPDFRKFGGYTVFNEGWALYAESLGKELGLFSDPYMWYGRLVDEQLRAMRLVVDTGLHAYGWSREKAIDYMIANSSMARSDVEAEVERYIVIPGQALAYKIGQRKIRQLRTKAENSLEEKFDIKKFHTQLLIDGSLPMPTLEKKIYLWIESQK